ncbi:Guanylate kinase 3 [Arachis hypogaea]|nr:Guanylate kinase 3 [Arachis hypogaea]
MVEGDELLEYALVYGDSKGVCRSSRSESSWRRVMILYLGLIYKTETVESLLVRIATTKEEVKHVKNFDYCIVNADGKLENVVKLVESIIDSEKARHYVLDDNLYGQRHVITLFMILAVAGQHQHQMEHSIEFTG